LRAATERLGGKGKIAIQGDRATLSFTAVPFAGLRTWLGEARSGARARPVEAQLLKASGGYSGSISLTLPGAS
jgi:general secretion pathway protein M